MKSFLCNCNQCGRATSKAYARRHGGQCKSCTTGIEREVSQGRAERDNANLIDAGYQAYARERGDYDLPDYA